MIVVEKFLETLFVNLPLIDGFTTVYKWGNKLHLLKQLELYSKEAKTIYPLIYQTSNSSVQGKGECETKLSLVLACQNLNIDLTNEQRWAMSYENVLYPLVENIENVFRASGSVIWNNSYTITEFPNYGSGEENFTIDKWDAILLETTIKITNVQTCN
jgi:hypothetical protein